MSSRPIEIGQIWRENGYVWLLLSPVESQVQYDWPGWRALDLETGEVATTLESWLLEGERIA